MARYYACASLEGARRGYRTARTELAESVPPHAVDGVLAAYRTEGVQARGHSPCCRTGGASPARSRPCIQGLRPHTCPLSRASEASAHVVAEPGEARHEPLTLQHAQSVGARLSCVPVLAAKASDSVITGNSFLERRVPSRLIATLPRRKVHRTFVLRRPSSSSGIVRRILPAPARRIHLRDRQSARTLEG